MIKNNKGITLVALMVTVIIIAILASIATYYGLENVKDANFKKMRANMQTIQLKVNELYEEYRSGNETIDDGLSAIDSTNDTWQEITQNGEYSDINFGNVNDYKRYYPNDIEKIFDISDFPENLLINIKNRRIIIENGYEFEGDTYYILEDFEDLMYNSDYTGFKYEVFDDYPYSTISIKDVNIKSSKLPIGYTQLEYIESNGTQYIDTDYIPKINTKIVLELSFSGTFKNTNTYGGYSAFLGVTDSDKQYFSINFGGGPNQGNQLFPWFNKNLGIDGQQIESLTITDTIRTNRNTLTIEKGNITYGSKNGTISQKSNDQIQSMLIFGRKTASGECRPFTEYNMKVYSMKIYEDNKLKKDFIPVVNVNNENGLFDLVDNKFYENNGTGEFVAGQVQGTTTYFYKVYYKKAESDTWIENTNLGSTIIKIDEAGTYSVKVESLDGEESVQYDNIEVNPTQDIANAPELTEDMIPVVWNREKLSWVKADINNPGNSWYNYSKDENRWANVAIVSENGTNSRSFYKNAEEDTEILIDDIEAMFVWIPRFKYTIDGPTYNVVFSNGLKDLTVSESILPESFGGFQKGIWVGKFECSKPGDSIQIKPNQNSINNIAFSNAKTSADSLASTYNLTGMTSSILSDNIWTAVAILSKYATSNSNIYNNSYYEGMGSNTIRTGMAGIGNASTEYDSSTDTNFQKTNKTENTGTISLKGFLNGNNVTYDYYEYWTENGQKASTTQNVYGIYDMVGGYKEYVIYDVGNTAYTRGGTYSESFYKDIINEAVQGNDLTATYRVMLTVSNE